MKHTRAVLVLLHLVAVTAMALPGPAAAPKAALWQRPSAQKELQGWADLAGHFGIHATTHDVADFFTREGLAVYDARQAAAKPFLPYATWLGTNQGWRLFSFINREPGRLYIDLDRGQGWESLFVYGSNEFTWRRQQLEQERTRAVLASFSWGLDTKGWEHFVDWLAARASTDFPDGKRLRARMFRLPTPAPEDVRAGRTLVPGKFEQERVVPLGHRP